MNTKLGQVLTYQVINIKPCDNLENLYLEFFKAYDHLTR